MQTSFENNDDGRDVVFLYKLVRRTLLFSVHVRRAELTAFWSRSRARRPSRTARTSPPWPVSRGAPKLSSRSSKPHTDDPFVCSDLVDRAIGISKTFEETSRARELKMRANEALPLTQQADAAFLLKLVRLSLAGVGQDGGTKQAQLLRTLETVRKGVEAVKATKAVDASA